MVQQMHDPRCYGYIRVSHEESALSGLSPEAQKGIVVQYHDRLPAAVPWAQTSFPAGEQTGMFCDLGVSGWAKSHIAKRPAGRQICSLAQPGDHIIFPMLDRGFRSVLDFAQTVPAWIDRGVNVHLATEQFALWTAAGKLLGNVLAAVAQFRSDMQSERQKEANARKRAGLPPINGHRHKHIWQASDCAAALWKPPPVELAITGPTSTAGIVFSYGRVSHLDSLRTGLSLDAQEMTVNRYAEGLLARRPELTRGQHFADLAVSAFGVDFRERPEGRLLESILRSGDHVVVAKLDRGWRGVFDCLATLQDWQRRGITAHFADTMLDTSTPIGEMFVELLAVLAHWESRFISMRTKQAMEIAKRQGRPVNQEKPIGTKVFSCGRFKKFVPDASECRIAWWIVHLRDRHGMSWDQISDHIESSLAAQDGRAPIPRGGRETRKKVQRRGRQGRLKGRFEHRPWGRQRCQNAYRAWPRISQMYQPIGSVHQDGDASLESTQAWNKALTSCSTAM